VRQHQRRGATRHAVAAREESLDHYRLRRPHHDFTRGQARRRGYHDERTRGQ
jgi:hypothetical protein